MLTDGNNGQKSPEQYGRRSANIGQTKYGKTQSLPVGMGGTMGNSSLNSDSPDKNSPGRTNNTGRTSTRYEVFLSKNYDGENDDEMDNQMGGSSSSSGSSGSGSGEGDGSSSSSGSQDSVATSVYSSDTNDS